MGIRMTGFKEHEAANANRLKKTRDQTKIMGRFSAEYITSISPKRFRQKKTPEGKPWDDIEEKTRRGYARKYNNVIPGDLLRRSGHLMKSISRKVTKHGFSIFTNVVYAATHQFGRGGIKARKFLGFDKATRARWAKAQEKWLASGEKP